MSTRLVGHRAATERRGQTGHRGSVSDPGLIIEYQDAGAADSLMGNVAGFVTGRGSRQETGGQPAVDRCAGRSGNEVLVPVVLHQPGDLCKCLVPRNSFPITGARGAVFRVLEPIRAVDEVHQAGALSGTGYRGSPDGPGRLRCGRWTTRRFRLVPQAVHDQAATHRAVRAGIAGLGTAGQLELAHLSQRIDR